MGILPMSSMGVSPMSASSSVSFFCQNNNNSKDTGKMPVRLMGKMPMLRR